MVDHSFFCCIILLLFLVLLFWFVFHFVCLFILAFFLPQNFRTRKFDEVTDFTHCSVFNLPLYMWLFGFTDPIYLSQLICMFFKKPNWFWIKKNLEVLDWHNEKTIERLYMMIQEYLKLLTFSHYKQYFPIIVKNY